MIEIKDLTVRFGGVTPLDRMTVDFATGTCGLIGPNGAGKTTFFNVLSGFVRPAEGSVTAFGEDLLAMAHFRRARWGCGARSRPSRRSRSSRSTTTSRWSHEHSSKQRAGDRREDVLAAIEFVGLDVDPQTQGRHARARERRLVEVARAVVGKPRVVLLDEPAAGLPDEETEHLGRVIQRIPERASARS